MKRSFPFSIIPALCLAGVFLVLLACSGKSASNTNVEKPIPMATPQPSRAASTTPVPRLPPPTESEVTAAFHRVFGDDFIFRSANPNGPMFIVGDFNGDQSEDL